MKRFKNILYVSFGSGEETSSLKQAVTLAANNQAELKVLVVYPHLPSSHAAYKANFESVMLEKMEDSVQGVLSDMDMPHLKTVHISIEGAKAVANTIVRRVLRDKHDLIIKEAETVRKGFKAIDMDLLRQCPCPVWLNRKDHAAGDRQGVAVAIDADVSSDGERALAIGLLQLAHSLAQSRASELTVISCWDYPLEDFLRHKAWTSVSDQELHKRVQGTEAEHKKALEKLVEQAGAERSTNIQHLRGSPDELVPRAVDEHKIEVLVMGTLAKTGISGFIIGNTAENVAHTLGCSLLALKPAGFISPVEAHE